MFLELDEFPFAPLVERGSAAVREEFDRLAPERFVQWPEREIYDFGWRAFPLKALGQTLDVNAALCPRTIELLDSIPNLVNAGFSLLGAGTHVHPHVGYTTSVYRFHLGVKIPEKCGLRVGGEVRHWQEGKLLAFDDMVEHSAWNESSEHRAVLLFDVLRPGTELEITPSSLEAVEHFLKLLAGAERA